jgi:hypothetical protein
VPRKVQLAKMPCIVCTFHTNKATILFVQSVVQPTESYPIRLAEMTAPSFMSTQSSTGGYTASPATDRQVLALNT